MSPLEILLVVICSIILAPIALAIGILLIIGILYAICFLIIFVGDYFKSKK